MDESEKSELSFAAWLELAWQDWRRRKREVVDWCASTDRKGYAAQVAYCELMPRVATMAEFTEVCFERGAIGFLCKWGWPGREVLDLAAPLFADHPEIRVDADGSFHNARRLMLLGDRTDCVVTADRGVTLLVVGEGAKVAVKASGWAVVNVYRAEGAAVTVTQLDHAKVAM